MRIPAMLFAVSIAAKCATFTPYVLNWPHANSWPVANMYILCRIIATLLKFHHAEIELMGRASDRCDDDISRQPPLLATPRSTAADKALPSFPFIVMPRRLQMMMIQTIDARWFQDAGEYFCRDML